MSEPPNQITEKPMESPTSPKVKYPASRGESPSLLKRLVFILIFILIVFGMLAITPRLAKEIAYAWNTGVERARAEAARRFLADNPLAGAEQRVAWVAKAVTPSVVGINSIVARQPDARGHGGPDMLGNEIGSGVIVDTQGYILTNEHVIANAHVILVRLSDGREVEAVLVGRDRPADLAVLQIDMDDLQAIPWGDSRLATAGERVAAIGNPYNLQQTVTSGIISATERYSPEMAAWGIRRGRWNPREFLLTDATINPGNSGGALVDMNGKLIGICTATFSAENGGNTGIGFAIPSFVAQRIYEEIVSYGKIKHGWLGVELDYVTAFQSQQMNQKKPIGAVVTRIRGTSVRSSGLKEGDIILRWGTTEITDPLHLSHAVLLSEPGTKETVEIFRDGELLKLDVPVGVRPTDF